MSGCGKRLSCTGSCPACTTPPRFFIEHGVIHDRVTGKHVRTSDNGLEDGIEECCALLNELSEDLPGKMRTSVKRYAALCAVAKAARESLPYIDPAARGLLETALAELEPWHQSPPKEPDDSCGTKGT